jgi:hypothetical protein
MGKKVREIRSDGGDVHHTLVASNRVASNTGRPPRGARSTTLTMPPESPMRTPALGRWGRYARPAAAALVATLVAAGAVVASDHQDTPFVEFNQRFDVNDVYAFPGSSPDRVVLVLGTSSPLTPAGTPTARFANVNEAIYQLKIDNTGDAVEDRVIQISFTPGQGAQVVKVVGPVKPNETGTANTLINAAPQLVITGRTNQVLGSASGIQVFAGPRDDPFFIDLEQFFRIIPDRRPESGPLSQIPSTPTASSFRAPGAAVDYVRGLNDLAIVVELPTAMLTDGGRRPRFGVWGTSSQLRGGPRS